MCYTNTKSQITFKGFSNDIKNQLPDATEPTPLFSATKKRDSVYSIGKVVGMEVLDIKLEDCLIARVLQKE